MDFPVFNEESTQSAHNLNLDNFVKGDHDFHAEIPCFELNPQLSNAAQRSAGHFSTRDAPHLSGRSPEEVRQEAARIKLGEKFKSFEEFDRCLHSFNVLNMRATHKLSTRRCARIRVCRFGPTVRKNKAPTLLEDPPSQDAPPSPIGGLKKGSSIQKAGSPSSFDEDNSEKNKENQGHVAQQHRMLPLPHDCHPLGPMNMTQANGIILDRIPLLEYNVVNRLGRSYVQNTQEWLTASNPKKTGRKVPKAGACGQNARFQPEDADSENLEKPKPCEFRVRASLGRRTGKITITVADLKHTCPHVGHRWRAPAHSAEWLAVTLSNRVAQNIKGPVADLLGTFRMDYKKSTVYQQAWRAKDQVRDWFLGGQRTSYHKIPALLHRLTEVDPECVVDWDTEPHSKVFRRAFICPSACRDIVPYIQPLVSLDACHTKNRKYPTQLFMATALDGNGVVVILCYTVAPAENKENWTWFLELMKKALKDLPNDWIPLISDRAKGLLPSVAEVFPQKKHAYCANHLRGNVKTKFGKTASQYFTHCVYANTKTRFDAILDQLILDTSSGKDAAAYIRNIDPKLWTRFGFPLPRLGKVSSNPAEQANSGLLHIRQYAPWKILVEMWFYIQAKHVERKAQATQTDEELAEVALRRHKKNLDSYGQWQVLVDGDSSCKVQTVDMKEEYLVSLEPTPTCSCWELQEMIWPCQHVMAWDDLAGRDYSRHFHPCWKVASLRAMYNAKIPSFLSQDLPLSDMCMPPEIAVKRGRHRVVRIPSGGGQIRNQQVGASEYVDNQGHLYRVYDTMDNPERVDPMPRPNDGEGTQSTDPPSHQRSRKSGKTVRCGKCGGAGHNRRTCKSGTPESTTEMHTETQAATQSAPPVSASLNEGNIDGEHYDETIVPRPNEVELFGSEGENGEFGRNDYSDQEESDVGDDSHLFRGIYGGQVGSSQNSEKPNWFPWNLEDLSQISQVQNNIELGWRPVMQTYGNEKVAPS